MAQTLYRFLGGLGMGEARHSAWAKTRLGLQLTTSASGKHPSAT